MRRYNMEELEEYLQHHGVKGMKWGVIRSKVKGAYAKSHQSRENRKKAAINQKHDLNMKISKSYGKAYNKSMAKNGNHYKSIAVARQAVGRRKVAAMAAIIYGVPAAGKVAGKAYRTATNPSTIRLGKNIVQAMKNSPLRYVDGAKMKNVIN